MTTRETVDDVLDQLPGAKLTATGKPLASERGRATTDMAAVLALVAEWATVDCADDELVLQELAASNALGLSLCDTDA